MVKTKLRKPTFKYIENELRNYHNTLREIGALQEEIMYPYRNEKPNTAPGYNSARVPDDPTGRMGIRLANHKELKYLEGVTNAIKNVYESSPEEYQKLIRTRYWTNKRLNWDGIALELNVSRRQAIRWRDEIVETIANTIGMK
ncbi:MAG: transcriptional regulator [Sporolactobacillus sp.]